MRHRLVVLLVLAATALAADPPGSADARRALALCGRAEALPSAEARTILEKGFALAERAVATDEDDALAHFAVFCTLGEQLRTRGPSLWTVWDLRRLHRAVDRTLELAPDFADALAGKGALLLDSPRLLGGDPADGEIYLRRALEVDPDWVAPRLDLVRALQRRGAITQARSEAIRALAVAEAGQDTGDAARARALLVALGE